MIKICYRKVYIKDGQKTQTVNICSVQNKQGLYDYVIRIEKPNPFVSEFELEGFHFDSIDNFIQFIVDRYKGYVEKKPDDLIDIDIIKEESKESNNEKFNSDLWLKKAIPVVDLTINKFVKLFSENPYLHRCESSIHCELYNMLIRNEILNKLGTIDDYKIRLIHKEWPEYYALDGKSGRGETDIAILSPTNLDKYNISDYKNGRIEAPIAIELCLNYKYNHFKGDVKKLINSSVYKGYIIHLVREIDVTDNFEFLENAILSVETNQPKIKIAYARIGFDGIFTKFIGQKEIIKNNY